MHLVRAVLGGSLLNVLSFGALDAQSIVNTSHPENLKVTNVLPCLPVNRVGRWHTPVDLYTGVIQCLVEGKLEFAFDLPLAARAFGQFGMARVPDKTAHQTVQVHGTLVRDQLRNKYSQSDLEDVQTRAIAPLTPGSDFSDLSCQLIERVGPPKYDPFYMKAHVTAALDIQTDKIEPVPVSDLIAAMNEINAEVEWEKAISFCLKGK